MLINNKINLSLFFKYIKELFLPSSMAELFEDIFPTLKFLEIFSRIVINDEYESNIYVLCYYFLYFHLPFFCSAYKNIFICYFCL